MGHTLRDAFEINSSSGSVMKTLLDPEGRSEKGLIIIFGEALYYIV